MPFDYLHLPFNPIANPAAIVTAGSVRFTVLTSRLLRLEYSPTGAFADRPSQAFWYRKQPVPAFDVRRGDGTVEIETEYLLLRYTEHERGFTPISLSVRLAASAPASSVIESTTAVSSPAVAAVPDQRPVYAGPWPQAAARLHPAKAIHVSAVFDAGLSSMPVQRPVEPKPPREGPAPGV